MDSNRVRPLLGAFLLLGVFGFAQTLTAQVGAEVGLAAIGQSALKAGGELEDILRKDQNEVTYDDLSGETGIFAKIGGKYKFGGLRLAGDLGYIYIQNAKIKLTQLDVAEDSSVSATFEVGTSLVPVSAGLEYSLPIPVVRPYAGVYPTYTFVNRTFTQIEGDEIKDIENKSAGENEFGLGVEAGIEIPIVATFTLGVSARYTSANLFTADAGEDTFGTFLVGVSIWAGSFGSSD